MCFGVRDAIAEAEQRAVQGPLTILGELVHNPIVRERFTQRGVREATLDDFASATPQVMITAHGASNRMRAEWRAAGFGVADGTCPLVKYAHDQLRLLVELGYFPIVIGKPGHVEVEGLTGDFPGACVIEHERDIARLAQHARYGVISQTTQPLEKALALVEAIRRERPDSEVRFADTVCQPTKSRQNALRELIEKCDTIIVVGGYNSNNTHQLVTTARAAGRLVYHIERPAELDPHWFRDSQTIGLTAGTSTLKETVAAVHERLKQIALHRAP
jgi:4-hydroxy-3-methylbut-2-enyl diphosphate reductase